MPPDPPGTSRLGILVRVEPGRARLTSGSIDGTRKVWDTASDQCLRTLKGTENVKSGDRTPMASGFSKRKTAR